MYTAAECAHSGDPTLFPLPGQIRNGTDAALPVHVERGETEEPGADHGQSDDVGARAADLGHELGKRELGEIELPIGGEAGEALMMPECEPGMVDSFCPYEAETEVAKVIVVGGGDGQRQ
jgi:hypothetical protein